GRRGRRRRRGWCRGAGWAWEGPRGPAGSTPRGRTPFLPSPPTGLADGFGAGRSPTRVYRPCLHGGIHAIHPKLVVPRFPCGIRRVRTEPTRVTAGTTALRYRTLIDVGAGFQAVPLDR